MSKPTVSAAGGAMPAEGRTSRRAALGAMASLPALAILPGAVLAAPPSAEAGYRGPGVYTGQGVAAIVGAPLETANGVDIGPTMSGLFVPVILTKRDGRVSRFLLAIDHSAEFGLTLSARLDAEAVRSIADSWIRRTARTDPIFAAIDRHKVAFNQVRVGFDRRLAREQGGEVTLAEREAACAAEDEALQDLIATIPTTVAGARAAIGYLVMLDQGCVPETSGKFLATLLKSPLLTESANG